MSSGRRLGFLPSNRRICWLAFAAELRFNCVAIQPRCIQLFWWIAQPIAARRRSPRGSNDPTEPITTLAFTGRAAITPGTMRIEGFNALEIPDGATYPLPSLANDLGTQPTGVEWRSSFRIENDGDGNIDYSIRYVGDPEIMVRESDGQIRTTRSGTDIVVMFSSEAGPESRLVSSPSRDMTPTS